MLSNYDEWASNVTFTWDCPCFNNVTGNFETIVIIVSVVFTSCKQRSEQVEYIYLNFKEVVINIYTVNNTYVWNLGMIALNFFR